MIWLYVSRLGGGAGPELVHRLLRQLYYERIDGELELVDVTEVAAKPPERPRPTLVGQWDALLAELPADWSDLWAEVELTSSDYLELGALMLAPVNPARAGRSQPYRFRVARRVGFGASEEMARRCLERLDQEGEYPPAMPVDKSDKFDVVIPGFEAMEGVELVQKLPLFRKLTFDETRALFAIARLVTKAKGEVVIEEDSLGSAL